MTTVWHQDPVAESDVRWLCSMTMCGRTFGIDTRDIREVLGSCTIQRVPLSPRGLGGVLSYRGEVLTAVDLRELLDLEASSDHHAVLVLEDREQQERFALIMDSVGGVLTVKEDQHEPNPTTLQASSKLLFAGAYKLPEGLIVLLDPRRLRPSRLVEVGLLASGRKVEPI